MEGTHTDKVEYHRREKGGSGKGSRESANRRESIISQAALSSSCGQISNERSRDMVGLNKHRSQAAVIHASGLILTGENNYLIYNLYFLIVVFYFIHSYFFLSKKSLDGFLTQFLLKFTKIYFYPSYKGSKSKKV